MRFLGPILVEPVFGVQRYALGSLLLVLAALGVAEHSLALLASLRCSLAPSESQYGWGKPPFPHAPRSGRGATCLLESLRAFGLQRYALGSPSLRPLPIDPLLPEIVRSLERSPALVLTAEPGAGKTTRVPGALLDAGVAGQILVAEPRRLPARLAASYVAKERGESVGKT